MAEATGPAGARVALVHDFLVDVRGAERVFLALCDMFPGGGPLHGGLRRARDRGPLRPPPRPHELPPVAAPDARARSARCCRCTRRRWSRSTCAATTSCSRARAPGRTASSPTSARSTSATATTRSATRGTRARRRSPAAARSAAPRSRLIFQRWRAVGLDRRPARGRLRRELRDDARGGSRATSGATRPSCTRRSRPARFAPGPVGDAYVVLSELMPHKRIDVAIRAFNELRRPLVVIGNGPDARRLRRLAGPTITLHRPRRRRRGRRAAVGAPARSS